ncbi:Uncharacterised protein [Mycobacteroides abscessus subsp. abscessus]|nr:Uncharacterised protein [Mycobacteroides abscessus subsp. abscessus]
MDAIARVAVGVQQVVQAAGGRGTFRRTVGEYRSPPLRGPRERARACARPALVDVGDRRGDLLRVREVDLGVVGGLCPQRRTAWGHLDGLGEACGAEPEPLVNGPLRRREDRERETLALPLGEQLGDHPTQNASSTMRRRDRHPGKTGRRNLCPAGNRHLHPIEHRHPDKRAVVVPGVPNEYDVVVGDLPAEIRALVVGNRVSHRERARIRGDDLVPVGVRGPSQVECAAAIVR